MSPRTAALDTDTTTCCRSVIWQYHEFIDRGIATQALQLVDDSAIFEIRGQVLDRAGIAEFLRDREANTSRHTIHLIPRLDAVETSKRGALALSGALYLFSHDGDHYTLDRALIATHGLVRTRGAWKLAYRSATPLHDLTA